ncbi:MAG: corrinoid protein [Dehalococcoidia bacterium]|nr:corrinoid protein [Dehalococcoidia bacterium]
MSELEEIGENLIEGQADKVRELTQAAVDKGIGIEKILDDGLIAGMMVVGERFKRKEIYLPEVLFSARAMKAGMEVLEPLLLSAGAKLKGKVILGTVQGDVHDIGKNLVAIMLKGAGFEVIDLGVSVSPQQFIDAAKEQGARLVGMSALLGTSMPMMQTTIEAFEAAGLKGQIKTMIGGAIVTQSYADKIGADGYAPDAASGVDKAKELLGLS